MINEEKQNNRVFLKGEIVTEARFSHEVYGEGFYEMDVLVKRLSGQADVLPVTISERLIESNDLKVGANLCAIGQFRSYNKLVDGKSKLMLTVFVREVVSDLGAKNPNNIVLSGYQGLRHRGGRLGRSVHGIPAACGRRIDHKHGH